jgi:hypothetical protein
MSSWQAVSHDLRLLLLGEALEHRPGRLMDLRAEAQESLGKLAKWHATWISVLDTRKGEGEMLKNPAGRIQHGVANRTGSGHRGVAYGRDPFRGIGRSATWRCSGASFNQTACQGQSRWQPLPYSDEHGGTYAESFDRQPLSRLGTRSRRACPFLSNRSPHRNIGATRVPYCSSRSINVPQTGTIMFFLQLPIWCLPSPYTRY